MIDSDIRGWIVEYPKGKMWKTPSGKFFWRSSGAAKNAFSCHDYTWLPPEVASLGYYEKKKRMNELKKEANFIVVTLKAVKDEM